MDMRPIGVFDSGMGGLTAVAELMKRLPQEHLVYFGDTGRVPSGGRSPEIIAHYARQDVAFLKTHDLKAILVACGTVSTIALAKLQGENDLPILGVAQPAALAAAHATQNGKIGLIGTPATIKSGAYEGYIATANSQATVLSKACPLFVPLVEAGRVHIGDVVIETVCAEYLAPFKEAGVDTLVLGCTHYPLLKEVIGNFMGEGVTLIDSGAEGAKAVEHLLAEKDALASPKRLGERRFYVSDSTENFTQLASLFLQQDVEGAVSHVDINQYQG